jgi:6-phosphogluconolactonase
MGKLNIYNTPDEVVDALAAYFVKVANESITAEGKFSVALSGGSSPKKLYELLASPAYKSKVDWDNVYFFFGDERDVPQDDKDSNYLMVKTALFDTLNIDESKIFAVDTSLEPKEAAAEYTKTIQLFFDEQAMQFDLVLLGLGDNSHTASLFPHTAILNDTSESVQKVFLDDQQIYRISFTAPLINAAHHIAFLVYGDGKAIAVHHVLEGAKDIPEYPAQLIAPTHGDVKWFLDEAAAANLKNK